ncbi:hypothetical protein [Rhodobacter ferrooxidans]|uniref:hypothetical protein n=1 Tax=Rhodobacter ferrooxidans TaxID=371731 RepID=UPI0003085E46|nr:hypothetical protein [Rhodobacter sp. SW2]
MLIGLVVSGIVAGMTGVAWGIAAGVPLLGLAMLYPLSGLCGVGLFLGFAMRRCPSGRTTP